MYVRLESELMQWRGPLRDTDEVSWSFELADLLDWKRLQRLRIVGAGYPLHDFWLGLDSLNEYFGTVLTLHRPSTYACTVQHTTLVTHSGAPPAILHIPLAPAAPPPPPDHDVPVPPTEPPADDGDADEQPVRGGAAEEGGGVEEDDGTATVVLSLSAMPQAAGEEMSDDPSSPPPPPFGSCVVTVGSLTLTLT